MVTADSPGPRAARGSGRTVARDIAQAARRTSLRRARPPLLTARDHALITDLARFGALTLDQLARRHFGAASVAVCRRRMGRLRRAGLVSSARVWYRGPGVYLATARGVRLVQADLGPARLVPETAAHQLAVADLADWCLGQVVDGRWVTERELRRDVARAARVRTDGPLAVAAGLPHVPDGVLVAAQGRTAIELELSAKPRAAYERILRWYAGAAEFEQVRWFVRSETLRRRLDDLVRTHGLEEFMTVESLPALVRVPVWR
jgi:Replication-relaxation